MNIAPDKRLFLKKVNRIAHKMEGRDKTMHTLKASYPLRHEFFIGSKCAVK